MAALGFVFDPNLFQPREHPQDQLPEVDPWEGGDILVGALSLASRGWPVFPCKADKKPATANGFYDASLDPEQIKVMFSRPGAAFIAVPMGERSGLIAIDLDLHGDSDGSSWYEERFAEHPATLMHQTRSGGCHLLYQMPAGITIKNSVGKLAAGVDVRGEGGYVIMPPSPGYESLRDLPPAEMPEWLVNACVRKAEPAASTPAMAGLQGAPEDRADKWAQAALDSECGAVLQAPQGTRNDRLNVAAVKLGSIVGGGSLSRSTVEASLTRAALAAGLDAAETAATIRSGLEHGLTTPRSVPERETQAKRSETQPTGAGQKRDGCR